MEGRAGFRELPHEMLANSVVSFTLSAPTDTDLKTVVRKLREDSEHFSQTLETLPNPNRSDASQPRKKRWAARVKTGCVTCRYVYPPRTPSHCHSLGDGEMTKQKTKAAHDMSDGLANEIFSLRR